MLHTEVVAGATLELLRRLQNEVMLKGSFSWKAVEKRLHDMVAIVG